jgi:subtilisin family serine protease
MAQFRSESKSMNRPTLCLVILCLVSINHVNAQTKIKILRPKEELSTGFLDLSLNRINLVHDQYPSFRGDSIRISVKEQGFDTTDIDLVGRSFHTGRASSITTSHAAIMATIIAGAGNSSQEALGVAPAASVGSTSFANLFAEPELFFRQNGISIQNHSYGTVVESFYGPEAASYDSLAHAFPELSLVFSSGNSGTAASATGPYAGLAGVANLTGNFKMAKNIITVGATDSLGVLEALSSRGPAYDGRVKPELTAFGQDGSSGASALVSGTVALLQQAYRRAFNILPSSSLVKALLLNSAEDAGPAHVGMRYKHSRKDGGNLIQLQTVKQKRFLSRCL